jgi:hypothetical protein
MCIAVKLIIAVALHKGVPLRGSISTGNAVCSARTLRFVGPAIADAFLWAENKQRLYRSVGVDITPATLETVRAKLLSDPMPRCWDCRQGVPEAVLRKETDHSETLIWFRDCLFLNHWSHGIFTGGDPGEMFRRRNLPFDEPTEAKLTEMLAFFEAARLATAAQLGEIAQDYRNEITKLSEQSSEYLALDQVRSQRTT